MMLEKKKTGKRQKVLLMNSAQDFISNRNIQGDTLTYGRPRLKKLADQEAVDKELSVGQTRQIKGLQKIGQIHSKEIYLNLLLTGRSASSNN